MEKVKNMMETCVIPAAGKGARWAPVSGYLPKEMLPLVDKPVIEWTIKEAISSGLKQIVLVISKRKEIIKNYFLSQDNFPAKANLIFIYQDEPLGIADAIFRAKKLIGNRSFVVALPDLPTISTEPVTKQLVVTFERLKESSHIVSFDKFSRETAHLYGECLLHKKAGGLLEIEHFCPKEIGPDKFHHTGNIIRMSGRFIFTPKIFPIIEQLLYLRKENEISDRIALREAQSSGQKVVGLKIRGHTYDTGYPEGYVRANTAFFKKFAHRKGRM